MLLNVRNKNQSCKNAFERAAQERHTERNKNGKGNNKVFFNAEYSAKYLRERKKLRNSLAVYKGEK